METWRLGFICNNKQYFHSKHIDLTFCFWSSISRSVSVFEVVIFFNWTQHMFSLYSSSSDSLMPFLKTVSHALQAKRNITPPPTSMECSSFLERCNRQRTQVLWPREATWLTSVDSLVTVTGTWFQLARFEGIFSNVPDSCAIRSSMNDLCIQASHGCCDAGCLCKMYAFVATMSKKCKNSFRYRFVGSCCYSWLDKFTPPV